MSQTETITKKGLNEKTLSMHLWTATNYLESMKCSLCSLTPPSTFPFTLRGLKAKTRTFMGLLSSRVPYSSGQFTVFWNVFLKHCVLLAPLSGKKKVLKSFSVFCNFMLHICLVDWHRSQNKYSCWVESIYEATEEEGDTLSGKMKCHWSLWQSTLRCWPVKERS